MFELLSDVESAPVDQDSLVSVFSGMNKVKVSVGEHTSEPSEVYIITGLINGNLETYIIFHMLEPGIHVVYGCDQNPYAPNMKVQVLEEATNFVEEMGSIMEEIPWETMTGDQRAAWIEKEMLYPETFIEELEVVQEVETLDDEQMEEVVDGGPEPEEILESGDVEGFVEISDEEVEQVILESSSEDEEADRTSMDDVVVAEGDFDELLKQAFLKPDVVEKTKKKPAAGLKIPEEGKASDDDLADLEDSQPADLQPEAMLQQTVESPEAEERSGISVEVEADEVETVEFDLTRKEKSVSTLQPPSDPDAGTPAEKDHRVKVIRFLSKF